MQARSRTNAVLAILTAAFVLAMSGGASAAQESPAQEAPSSERRACAETAQAQRWKRPPQAEIKRRLSPEQYRVTQKDATERPFRNEFWDNHEDGIYVDVVSGEPLFSSLDKFDSGTGWPSFHSPLEPDLIVERTDRSLWMERTEVRSRHADSHLGHLFDDGPRPTGLRYCINSAALRFIPAADLEKEGYGEYVALFDTDETAKAKGTPSELATFAMGCFWGAEADFCGLKGVLETRVGYAGGSAKNPSYRQVSSGRTGHAEVVQVEYDPSLISYAELLEHFWRNHDPTTPDRQGPDVGSQYRSMILYHNPEQGRLARTSKQQYAPHLRRPIVTEIVPAMAFYPAEDYHQRYLEKRGRARCTP